MPPRDCTAAIRPETISVLNQFLEFPMPVEHFTRMQTPAAAEAPAAVQVPTVTAPQTFSANAGADHGSSFNNWKVVKNVMYMMYGLGMFLIGVLIGKVWGDPMLSEFLGTATSSSQQHHISNITTKSLVTCRRPLVPSHYQAELWDLRQKHDDYLSDYKQFKIRVFLAVAVMAVASGAYLLSGMSMVRSSGATALSEFKATFRLLGLVLVTMYLVDTVTVYRF